MAFFSMMKHFFTNDFCIAIVLVSRCSTKYWKLVIVMKRNALVHNSDDWEIRDWPRQSPANVFPE